MADKIGLQLQLRFAGSHISYTHLVSAVLGQNQFLSSPSDTFHNYFNEEYEWHFSPILMTRNLDMVTDGSLK